MAEFATLDDIAVKGKRVIVRGDLNVPMEEGRVTDTTRLDRLATTIAELADKGAKVIVVSHFGRPKAGRDPKLSLKPVAAALSASLGGRKVGFAEDCIGPAAEAAVKALADGDIVVLENLRFHHGEEANDPEFARNLSVLGDLYVNDAFSAAHRAHASTEGLAHLLPAAAGRLMQAELEALEKALGDPARPVAALVGGAKVSTKLAVLKHLVERVDALVIGGAMANTFLLAQGTAVGRSLVEADMAATAKDVLARAHRAGCAMLLPEDAVVAERLAAGAEAATVAVAEVPADRMILDVGPKTVARITGALGGWRTLVWNGPLGAFETPPFDAATTAVAKAAAARTDEGALLTVAGGGDTVAALAHASVIDRFSYVSTAGGAFLEWLEGRELPGVAALRKAR